MVRETRLLMGMPITVEIVDKVSTGVFEEVFAYFTAVDERFSLHKPDSEMCALNRGGDAQAEMSDDMREVLALAAQTKRESHDFFEIRHPKGGLDPSGIVKGWAIRNAANLIRQTGAENYFVDAGGDIQCCGKNRHGEAWRVGIRNPFNAGEFIKTLRPEGRGVATSGTSARGQHIYNPHRPSRPINDIVSLTIIGPNVLEADRFATAAFAMGSAGIYFIEQLDGLDGYLIDVNGRATWTSGFGAFVSE
jgi:thiamine biosynthesis lipoprotein